MSRGPAVPAVRKDQPSANGHLSNPLQHDTVILGFYEAARIVDNVRCVQGLGRGCALMSTDQMRLASGWQQHL